MTWFWFLAGFVVGVATVVVWSLLAAASMGNRGEG